MEEKISFELSERPPLISQTFISLEGEGHAVGSPSLYIRLAGCNIRCKFCDTKFSWQPEGKGFDEIGDRNLTISLAKQLLDIEPKRLTITGGEPLMYMKWFPDIFNWVNEISPVGLDFLGIESNGNLLHKQENCLHLIESFNEIIKTHGIYPTLTISPKLDADVCYLGKYDQNFIDELYFTTFKNITDYLQPYNIYYKFIYDHTEKFIKFEDTYRFIDFLVDEMDVKRYHIMLMPFTPEDPLGKNKSWWEESKDATSRMALKHGLIYSPRIHVDRKLD